MDPVATGKTIWWLGETMGFWIQTGAFFLSAIGAIGVIWHNGNIARKRATIDLIIHQKSDQELLDAIRKVYDMADSNAMVSKYLENKESDEFKAVLKVLNNHEFIALGIRKKAFDEGIYKDLQCSNFIKIKVACSGFIAEIRKQAQKDTIFQEFEKLAISWQANPIKKIK